MCADVPEPTSAKEVAQREQEYQDRVDAWNSKHQSSMGSVLLPPEDAGPLAARMFHELMHCWGWVGVEYAQEALHQNHEYFRDYMDSVQEVREDILRMVDAHPDIEQPVPIEELPDRCQRCGERGVEVELCVDCGQHEDDEQT